MLRANHIGERCVLIGCRDSRCAAVLGNWYRYLLFAYPYGGANLTLLIHFQELLIVSRNPCCNTEWKLLIKPPPSPMPAVEEQLLVGQEGDDVYRAIGDTGRLLDPMYHTR